MSCLCGLVCTKTDSLVLLRVLHNLQSIMCTAYCLYVGIMHIYCLHNATVSCQLWCSHLSSKCTSTLDALPLKETLLRGLLASARPSLRMRRKSTTGGLIMCCISQEKHTSLDQIRLQFVSCVGRNWVRYSPACMLLTRSFISYLLVVMWFSVIMRRVFSSCFYVVDSSQAHTAPPVGDSLTCCISNTGERTRTEPCRILFRTYLPGGFALSTLGSQPGPINKLVLLCFCFLFFFTMSCLIDHV